MAVRENVTAIIFNPTMRIIRHATTTDVERIMQVLDAAKQVMRSAGNENQWINGYPNPEAILADIEHDGAMVVEDDGVVVAYFAFLPSPEPTYACQHLRGSMARRHAALSCGASHGGCSHCPWNFCQRYGLLFCP